MKNIKLFYYISLFSFALIITSCDEEEKGPLVTDSIPPSELTEVKVTNLPGGAKIEYKIPNDEDAILVEASYMRNKELITARSSIFKNNVLIEGLKDTSPQEVELKVVDRSNNLSAAVKATINPETAPIDKLFSSFELVPDFGGVRLKYNNEDNIKAELLLYSANENGSLTYNQSAFISDDNKAHNTYRSFDPTPHIFGVAAIDRWNNITEIKKATILPIKEEKLDIQQFDNLSLNGDEPDRFSWVMTNLWNGAIDGAGFHTDQTTPGTVIPPYTESYHMFTMDLGVTAQLSRFKLWLRQGDCCGTPYAHGDPRYFEVWGTDEIPADNGTTFEGWTKLVENGEIIKPSGGAIGTNSAEDIAQAAQGEEFEISIETPVRYIRFVNFENWSGTKFMHFTEINFWGQIID